MQRLLRVKRQAGKRISPVHQRDAPRVLRAAGRAPHAHPVFGLVSAPLGAWCPRRFRHAPLGCWDSGHTSRLVHTFSRHELAREISALTPICGRCLHGAEPFCHEGCSNMSSPKPVVVYAASGYTGRLTCDFLTKWRIPFVAAGRNQSKLEEWTQRWKALGADCEAVAVEHSPQALQQLFRGRKAVINVSGPFSKLGRVVVEAALSSGCHYMDPTGEQDFMLDIRREFGAQFERAKLALMPSTSFMYTWGNVATEICLETPGIDTIRIMSATPPLQTVASMQSMMRTFRREHFDIQNGELTRVPFGTTEACAIETTNQVITGLRHGTSDATFYMDDARVRNISQFFCSAGVASMAKVLEPWVRRSKFVPGAWMDSFTDSVVLKLMKEPPPETIENGRFVVFAVGLGNDLRKKVILTGSRPYASTGFIGAYTARELMAGKAQRYGYMSVPQAFGARTVARDMEEVNTHLKVEFFDPSASTIGASPYSSRKAEASA